MPLLSYSSKNISTKNYPGQNIEIPRENHGGLNHLRSLKFSIAIIAFADVGSRLLIGFSSNDLNPKILM